ncbi:Ion channel CASTOR, variant 2 [Balamuthia mandrillaris]
MRGTDARGEGTPTTKEQDANFPSLLDKLRYKVDYFLSAKKYARFLALFGISFLLVTFCALLADLVVPDPSFHFGEAMWWSMVRVIDTGSLETSSFASSSPVARSEEDEDEETTGYYDGAAVRAVSVFTTLCGLAVVASLIGLVNTTIEERFEELRRGKSRVIDKDHTLILGFDREKLLVILEELRQLNWNEANADKKNKKNRKLGRSVVILSEQDKLEVEAMVHENLPDLLNTSVVVRQGSPHYPRDLIKVGADRARCTIILADKEEHRLQVERGVKGLSDMSAIKTLLALRRVDVGGGSGGCGSPLRNSQAIVIELKDERRRAVIERLGRGKVIVVNTQLTLSRILVQTSRQRGLAKIYAELLTYVGSEFYFRNFPELEGRKFGELQERVQGAVVLGLQRRGKREESSRGKADEHTFEYKTVLNPSDEFVLEKEDEVLVLAECGGAFDLRPCNEEEQESNSDDETTSLLQQYERKDEKEEENEEVKHKQKEKEDEERQHAHPETFLICGYAKKLPTVLHEFANYVPHGSRIYLMPGSSIADRDDEMVADIDAMSFPNLTIHWVQGLVCVLLVLRPGLCSLFFVLS